MNRLKLAIVCLVVSGKVVAQQSFFKKLFTRVVYDTSYVESYYDHFLHVTAVSVLQKQDLQVSSGDLFPTLKFSPNTAFRFGFGVDYNLLSLEYTQGVEYLDAPDPNKGNTNSFSLRLGVTGRRFLGSLLIQSYQGMYLSNPQDVIPTWQPTDPYPIRGDIRSEVMLGSLNYFFNNTRFSSMASLWQIDRQKKSAGSFTVGITASIGKIRSDSTLLPYEYSSVLPNNDRLLEGTNYLYGINFGYGYNLILFKNFFVNGLLIPGVDLQAGTYRDVNQKYYKTGTNIGYHGDFRFVTGYNGERYYCGFHYSNYFVNNRVHNNVDVNIYNGYLRFFAGRRFDLAPRKSNKKGK